MYLLSEVEYMHNIHIDCESNWYNSFVQMFPRLWIEELIP